MSNRIKKWCYWLSLIGPIFDVIKGTIIGIHNAYVNAKEQRQWEEANRVYDEELAQFRKDMIDD